MGKLYYFQAPSLDINPESSTSPKLGSIFSSLDTLTAPLNQDEQVNIPQDLMNHSAVRDFDETVGRSPQVSVGLNTTALQGLAGSADAVYTFARDKSHTYRCELLETVEFAVNKEFVDQSILASFRVQNFLENSLPLRRRVYMITGLKIATGFSMSASKEVLHNPTLKIGVDFTPMGVPVQAGPELGVALEKHREVSHGRTVNKIVFAYRVIRIKVKGDGESRYKYRSGGKYSIDDDDYDSDDEDGGAWEIEPLEEESRSDDFPDSVQVDIH
ncbi:uncharacterized protein DNG_07292 [Cephalotrichum gorgonifer]|uniref:Uncharacterized protein n=1 Tax=Cephalotrichum gorgonifer TaxID=2041049 RepID=A0AAE8SY26_9PEZI|nr:uncharacterized protein DNG_07292 [Cephalotrichum gorgonifer]